ncbi:MAG: hypothetical protein WAW81_01900, partial [Minisyncoccia bacterium]
YFNIKNNNRSGYLFQNSAKIIRMENDGHYLYIPFYIDLNSLDSLTLKNYVDDEKIFSFLTSYEWSSLKDYYIGSNHLPIINPVIFYKNFDFNHESYKRELVNLAGRRDELNFDI